MLSCRPRLPGPGSDPTSHLQTGRAHPFPLPTWAVRCVHPTSLASSRPLWSRFQPPPPLWLDLPPSLMCPSHSSKPVKKNRGTRALSLRNPAIRAWHPSQSCAPSSRSLRPSYPSLTRPRSAESTYAESSPNAAATQQMNCCPPSHKRARLERARIGRLRFQIRARPAPSDATRAPARVRKIFAQFLSLSLELRFCCSECERQQDHLVERTLGRWIQCAVLTCACSRELACIDEAAFK